MARRRSDVRAIGTIDTALTRSVVQQAIELGVETPELMAALERANEIDRHGVAEYLAVWELAMRDTKLPGFPIRVGGATTVERYGVYGYALYVAKTVEDAFRRGSRYHDVIDDTSRLRLELDGDEARFIVERPGPRTLGMRVANEQLLAAIFTLLKTYVGSVPAIEIQFRHAKPRDVTEHEALFGAPLRWSSPDDALVLPRSYLKQRTPGHDPVLERYILQQLQEAVNRVARGHGYVGTVSSEILARLSNGIPRASAIARALGTTERTLRRQLAQAGVAYTELVAALQRDRAEVMLREGVPIGAIALSVGFTDAAAFTRAFRRWTGHTPTRQLSRLHSRADTAS